MCRALRYLELVCVLIHQHNMPRNWCPILSGSSNFSFQYVNRFLACFAFVYNLFCDAKMKLFFLNCQIFFKNILYFILQNSVNTSKINTYGGIKNFNSSRLYFHASLQDISNTFSTCTSCAASYFFPGMHYKKIGISRTDY